ncbi:helix-turn-helix domain-containing protein [Actinomadura viridis]|uniref:helix-turn-helix domain-containing protein n=1 Tax=Actinomadura viridis TaxID=58110 RepID=UPI003691B67B
MPGPGNVGERVRNLRLTRRLSQAQLAGHDLSDSYISLIESGKRTPTPTVLRMLAERLGCTPEYLAEGVEPEQRAHLEVRERHAHLALLGGDPNTAERDFDEVIARSDDPDLTSRARWGRARALEELGRTGEAIALFEELREQAERDPGRASWLPPVIALARCYHAVGDLGQAVALGERALTRLRHLGLGVGHEYTEVGRILLLAYLDRSDPVRAHALGRRMLASPDGAGVEPEESGDPVDGYRQASSRALGEGAVGDALYLADQAVAAHGGVTSTLARARLNLAGAKALLRGVAAFSAELDPSGPPAMIGDGTPEGAVTVVSTPDDGEGGRTIGVLPRRSAGAGWQRGEAARVAAAEEALELLRGTAALEGSESTDGTIERARALVLTGRPEQAIAMLEEFLDTGMALAAPASGDPGQVTGTPDGDAARVRKTTQARIVLARARLAQQDPAAALVVLRAAVGHLDLLPSGRLVAQLLRELGELFEIAGDTKGATAAYRQALEAAGLRRPTPSQTADCDLDRV